MRFLKFVFYFGLLSGLFSCANLSHVHSFSMEASTAVKNYNKIDFSAAGYCQEIFCRDPGSYITGLITETKDCDCKTFSSSDQSIANVNKILTGYFQGLEKLTAKTSPRISYSELATAIKDLSTDAGLGISEQEVKAGKDLITEISVMVVSHYQRRQLKKTISNSQAPLDLVLQLQEKNILYLRTILTKEKDELKIANQKITAESKEVGLKFLLGLDLRRTDATLMKQDNLLKNYGAALERIRMGHQHLYEQRNTLKDAVFRKALMEQAAYIYTLVTEFNNLAK